MAHISDLADGQNASPRPTACSALRLTALGAYVGALFAATPAAADNLFVAPSILWRETYTSNAAFGIAPEAKSDLISELVPSIVLFGLTKNLQVSLNLVLDAIDYRHRTEPDAVLPNGGADLSFQGLDRHFFVDAAAIANQGRENVFAATPLAPSTYNEFTVEGYRLSPYFKGELPGEMVYVLRSDNALERSFGNLAPTVDARLALQSIDLDHVPHPLGWTLHAESSETQYTDSTVPILRQELGRAILKVAPDPQIVVSARGGIERENYLLSTGPWAIYGGGLEWRPSDRTSFEAIGERRFFGTEWDYGIKHREQALTVSVAGGRDVVTSAQTVFALPIGGDMAALLDSILVPTHPDPVERASAVQALLAQQNLPQTLAAGSTIYASAPVLLTSNKAALVWLARRDTVSLSIYDMRTQVLPGNLSALLTAVTESDQNDQRGIDLTLTHHLTPYTSVSADGRESKIEGIGSTSGVYTRQNAATVQLNNSLSPRTGAFVGIRVQAIESNVTPNARERAVLAGLRHQF